MSKNKKEKQVSEKQKFDKAMEALNKRAEAEERKGSFGEIELVPADLKIQTK